MRRKGGSAYEKAKKASSFSYSPLEMLVSPSDLSAREHLRNIPSKETGYEMYYTLLWADCPSEIRMLKSSPPALLDRPVFGDDIPEEVIKLK